MDGRDLTLSLGSGWACVAHLGVLVKGGARLEALATVG